MSPTEWVLVIVVGGGILFVPILIALGAMLPSRRLPHEDTEEQKRLISSLPPEGSDDD